MENIPIPLRKQVKQAADEYFHKLNGYEACDLYALFIHELEQGLFESVLEKTGHNQTKAAKILGISRGTLRTRLENHGINR